MERKGKSLTLPLVPFNPHPLAGSGLLPQSCPALPPSSRLCVNELQEVLESGLKVCVVCEQGGAACSMASSLVSTSSGASTCPFLPSLCLARHPPLSFFGSAAASLEIRLLFWALLCLRWTLAHPPHLCRLPERLTTMASDVRVASASRRRSEKGECL